MDKSRNEGEIFTVKARICSRCGGLLVSEYGLTHGMGHICKKKYDEEHSLLNANQLSLFDDEKRNKNK